MTTTAVIGAGVSGLTAAHVLARSPRRHPVRGRRPPRRARPHPRRPPRALAGRCAIDSGFIVHNERTYPHLLRLFGELGVRDPAHRDEHEHHLRRLRPVLRRRPRRCAGSSPSRWRVADPRFLRMLARGAALPPAARALLGAPTAPEPTWGEFLADGRLLRLLRPPLRRPAGRRACGRAATPTRRPTRPVTCSGSSTTTACSASNGSPTWRTVVGGSATYVDRLAARLPDVRRRAPVTAVERHDDGVDVRDRRTTTCRRFDRVVVATHADQALALLADATR